MSSLPSDYNQLMQITRDQNPAYPGKLTEIDLAGLQRLQAGNSCVPHSLCAAFQLLTGREIDPRELDAELNLLPFFSRLRYRSWNNGPVTPLQQVALARTLASNLDLQVTARLAHPEPSGLVDLIRQPATAVLVTIGWWKHHPPGIFRGTDTVSQADGSGTQWHTMLAAAYDPGHRDSSGNERPWGFVNSWVDRGETLFWMSDADFLRSWQFYTPFGGRRPAVILQRTPSAQAG